VFRTWSATSKDAAVRATASVAALEARLTETKAELVTAREEYALKLADTGQDAFSWFKDQAAKERARNDELQSERDAAVTELAVMREAATCDAARAAKAEREAQDARAQLEPVQTELASVQAEAEAASKRGVEAESQIESAQKSAQEAREAAASAALQVEELKQQMAPLKEEVSAASARADGLDGKLQAAQLQLAAMQTAHDSELVALNARVAALVQELDGARNEAAEWKAKFEHLHEHAVEPEHATALKQALQTERDARVLFQMEARAAAAVIAASAASPASAGGSGIKTRMAASPGALTAAARLFPQTSPQASAMVGVSTPVATLPSGLQRAAAATSG
jgi:DNA repair exonuclease SbcCD ATPase subunit